MGTSAAVVVLDSLDSVDSVLYRLQRATLKHERLVAERDLEIAPIAKRYAAGIESAAADIALFKSQIEVYCRAHPECFEPGKKSIQLQHGLVGLRAPSQAALVPLTAKWSWKKIEAKVRKLWKRKYFHKPKPPGIDKVKIKKELDAQALAQCGLKLDDTETFYLELNRLAVAADAPVQESAA